ncbi:BNR-4 repeat-containing protein [Klebsiella pneumoniae]
MAFNPELGSTSPAVLLDNAKRLDELVNGDAATVPDRAGQPLDTWRQMMAKNDEVRQNLIPLSKQYMTIEDAQADIANIPDGSTTYVRSTDDTALAVEYINNGGTLTATGRVMPSAYNPELSVVSAGMLFKLVSDVYSLTAGSYYTADGVLHTDGGSTWGMYKFPIKKGQWVKYTGPMGITTGSESIPVISQLDSNQAWVSSLCTVNATGAAGVTFQTLYGQATQDGFIAVRGRTAETSTVGAIKIYASYDEIVTTEDMLDAIEAGVEKSSQYGPGEDMTGLRYFQGSVFDASGNWVTGKGTAYRTYFIPVQKGDVVKYTGAMGSFILAETLPILVQADSNRNFVGIVYPFETDTKILDRAAWGIATQTGFIAVYVRIVSGINFTITKFRRLLDYRSGIADTVLRPVTHEATITRGQRMTMAGAAEVASGWFIATLPVRRGDDVAIDALHDSFSKDVTPVICQLDSKKAFVSVLCQFTNTGAGPNRDTFIATASQDGYVAVTARLTANAPFTLFASRQAFCDPLDIWLERQIDASGEADYTLVNKYEVNNSVIDSTFKLLTDTNYRTIWIPVRRGESVSAYTATGAAATGETPAADGSVPVMIQYDTRRANPVIRATASGTGSLTGYQTVSAKATADGYMAVRLYAADRGWPTVKRLAAKNGSDSGVASLPVVPGQFERLPVNADTNWDYNNSPYSQDNVVIAGDYQYVVVIGAGRVPYIAQRSKWGGAWLAVFDLGTIAGNPLASPTTADGHNVYNIGVSKNGHIIVAGNMHGDGPRAVVSDNPHNITAWTAVDFSAGMFTKDVTYPHFISYPDGTLQCYYRWGVRHYLTTYDESTKTFITPRHIVGAKADGRGGPYEQKYVVDNDGILHACWGYRMDATSALANEGLYYSQSADKGATWRAADGSVISAAGTRNDANSTRIFSAETGSGYVNQNGGCVDIHGHYHTCLTQYDDNGNTQIVHVWWDSLAWKSEVVTDFDFRMNLSSNLVMNDITRPVIGATPSGRVYIIYHTTYNGLSGAIMAIDVTDEGNPQSMVVAAFDIGTQSMGFNVAHMLKTGDFVALLAKGTANSASENYGVYSNQPVMLATIPMP